MPGIMVYQDDIELFDGFLRPEQIGKVVFAAMRYNETGEKDTDGFEPLETVLFRMMVRKIDRDKKKYEAQAANGSKGGRPKTQQNPTKPNESQQNPNNQTVSKTVSQKEIETKTVSEVVSVSVPTREQVRAYAETKTTTTDPDRFFDYYESRGWELKPGVPVRNWKSVFNIWVKNEGKAGYGGDRDDPDNGGSTGPGIYTFGI